MKRFAIRKRLLDRVAVALAALVLLAATATADDGATARAGQLLERGLTYLASTQKPDGSWQGSVAVTSLAASAYLKSPFAADKAYAPVIDKALAFIAGHVDKDGGVRADNYPNYSTSLAIMALADSGRPEYAALISNMSIFVQGLQMDKSDDVFPDDPRYGGVSYDGVKRPDLSNTHFAVNAIAEAGTPSDDPFFEKAVVFLQRLQNRKESNDQPWAGDDGGFVYAPDESKAGSYENDKGDKRLRSYGSMTYAGLMSYLYADVSPEDLRVRAAFKWVSENYSVEENPGMGRQGLFYYYNTLSKTLALMEVDRIVDAGGLSHDWRTDLVAKLAVLQQDDGSWVNTQSRWMETDPALVTAYACLALDRVLGGERAP